jgi:hypothetical protein
MSPGVVLFGKASRSSQHFPFFARLCVCWWRLNDHFAGPNRQSTPSLTMRVICFHHFLKRRHRKRLQSPNRSCCAVLINVVKRYQKRYLSQYLLLHFQIPNRNQHLLRSHLYRVNRVQECHHCSCCKDLWSFTALLQVPPQARSPPSPSSSCKDRYRTRSSAPGASPPSRRYPWRLGHRSNSTQGICQRRCRCRVRDCSGSPSAACKLGDRRARGPPGAS